MTEPPDSIAIVRADLDSRRTDTVGRVMQGSGGGHLSFVPNPNPPAPDLLKYTINPLREVDNWAVLSDGTVAFVRGHDYHIDWIRPDGTKSSTTKLPFDWKRLTDTDKQALVDSARQAQVGRRDKSCAPLRRTMRAARRWRDARLMEADEDSAAPAEVQAAGEADEAASADYRVRFPLSEIADYYPPIREGASIADLDGNLWILPTTSAQSQSGELVYDVVNPKRGLFQRVRMPVGRSVLGFGKGGVVYLMSGDRATGFYVEKTKLTTGAKGAP